ncbi:cellulase family glycosylhydrolase [Marinitenerispora sediminis]|uniref:Glycoside hydrolase family 5 domain-containing protein n=1 Tax=Marinitenerispora sediminis TaxID=1931232 RepID=A0A368T0B9_9ACTN|nr:cellulase family glycosylhydrolase [Marinitenerispora sediminis]RCV48391.1 hypothetical protein DEF28_23695 [Marinitenerispora sediminis]RCV52441.1 hypothetical protein DEF24_21955 [Marinitenerispora sediminis]RCV60101.1 hypothetical protein DEF23_05460 [Marinitenerispora sediminis]
MTFQVVEGRLCRDGRPYTVLGVNYHPSEAGCRIWTDWDPAALKADFADMAAAGLNTVRLFVFWRDFQPESGYIRPTLLGRLRAAVTAAGDAGLACVVSLFTIWMNGQRLDLPWRHGRSLWRDPGMLDQQEAFARAVARELADRDNLLAFDLGDEIGNVDPAEAAALPAADVAGWQRRIAAALRGERPGTLVTQANDASGVLGRSPFGPDNADGLDLVATHGFPTWAPGSIESTLAVKATHLAPFLARTAGAYGPAVVDELGSYGVDDTTAAHYLRAAAASALANGAQGIIPWCWRDITSTAEPYHDRPMERLVGLHTAGGRTKPAMAEYARVVSSAPALALRRPRAPVALYVPERARPKGGGYLDAEIGTLAVFYAYLLLKRAHLDFDVVAGDPAGYRLVVCPSVTHLTLADIGRIGAAAHVGASVYVSLGDHLHGFPGEEIAGARLVDFSLEADGRSAFSWGGRRWEIDWAAAAAPPVTVRPTTAAPVACYDDGSPALLARRHGAGRVLFAALPLERQLDRPGRLTSAPWEDLYRRVADWAGVPPGTRCDVPDVEIVTGRSEGRRRAVVVNHRAAPVETELTGGDGRTRRVALAAKDWRVLDLDGDHGGQGGQGEEGAR